MARFGYGARGVVYLLVGGLATKAGLEDTRPPGTSRVLAILSEQPLGMIMVGALAAGLFMYAAWRSIQSLLDLNDNGTSLSGLVRRGGMLLSAASHAALGKGAIEALDDWSETVSGEPIRHAQMWVQLVLTWPVGRWLVAAIGVMAIGLGLAQFAKAKGPLLRNLDVGGRVAVMAWFLGATGLAARGVIFAAIGGSFLLAAWKAEADPAGGLQAIFLHLLWEVPLGDWMFFVIAAGLIMFGAFNLFKGWFHRTLDSNW